MMLSACGGSSSSPTPAPTPTAPGSLVFESATPLAVKQASTHEVVLKLDGDGTVVGQRVRVTTSDSAIADVLPDSCTLSGTSETSRRCALKVYGKAQGSVALMAQSTGLADAQIAVSVSNAVNYGKLAVESTGGTYVSGPATLTFPNSGTAPFQMPLKARIVSSSGVDTSENVVVSFSGPNGVTFSPAQCTVTTQSPDCNTVASLPQAVATPIVVAASGASYNGYTSVAVNATPAPAANNGTIVLSTQSGNNVPNGMKAPLFVNWVNYAASDTVTLTLTLQGSGITFYSYAPGNNVTPVLSQTQTCTLNYDSSSKTNKPTSCGFGLAGSATSGTVTVNAAVTSSSTGKSYTVGSLVLGAVAPAPARRTVTFTNNSKETIYVGITGGAATAYTDATTPWQKPGQATANLKPGAASQCGPSNPQAACPIGTTCLQGGASPSTDVSKTPYYCYYDHPVPSNGYAIAPTQSTQITVSKSSIDANDVLWSGNFYPRTLCDTNGNCENATCRGSAGGLACGPGTGPSPGVNTLAELTFQAASNPDFYDVSIINGANFAVQFGPTNVPISNTSSYTCGTAGSTVAQNGGYTANGNGLPAASWSMAPSAASFPAGVTTTGDASSYYRVVVPTTTVGSPCTTNMQCTDAVSNTCGYAMSDILKGGFNFATRSCGKPVAWATANSIWGFYQKADNAAPFSFSTKWPNGTAGGGTVSVGDLQLCINQTYSAYIANGTSSAPVQPVALACGGVMWGATQSTLPIGNPVTNVGLGITQPSTPAFTANANWLDYVLPTITWLKQACPTCYTYPFDDMTSTFTCTETSSNPGTSYSVTFSDLK